MRLPTLAVCIPNYNHAHYLPECLTNILSQSVPPTEVIVVDDASTDDSVSVVERFAQKHPAVRLLRNESNVGTVKTSMRAFEAATSDYILGRSADDIDAPGFYEKALKLLARHPGAGACMCDPASIYVETGKKERNRLYFSERPCYFAGDDLAKILGGWFVAGHATMFRRDAFLECGGYRQELEWHSDWFVNLVVAFRYGVCYLPEPLAYQRIEKTSYSTKGRDHWPSQRRVLLALMDLVRSPQYRDVLPHFVRSGALVHFGGQLLSVVMSEPELWDTTTIMLLSPLLGIWATSMKQSETLRHERANANDQAMELAVSAERAYLVGDDRLAGELYLKALKTDPGCADLWNDMGVVLHSGGKTANALDCFRKALEINPEHEPALLSAARVSLETGEVAEARKFAERLLAVDPENAGALDVANFGPL